MRAAYLAGLFAWVTWTLFHAPWEGLILDGDGRIPGTFGLSLYEAPAWAPPGAEGGGLPASVRWPWQPATSGYFVQLSLLGLGTRIALGVVVLGGLVGGTRRFRARNDPDLLLQTAGSLSLSLLASLIGVHAISIMTLGSARKDLLFSCVLCPGAVAGLIHGAWRWRHAFRKGETPPV